MKKLIAYLIFTLIVTSVIAQGQCNEADLQYISENAATLAELSQNCATDCLSAENSDLCVQTCILENTPLSETCASCFSSQVACVVDNCLITCLFGAPEACEECAVENCLEAFNECAGIYDMDEDTYTNLNDCDDSNPNVYPGAPGTGEGIDNNCDGEIIGDELAPNFCTSDFNNNGVVEVADLTVFLTLFGCSSEFCDEDIDGVPGITSGDLTAFLTVFGFPCPQ